jgi:protein gp37
MPPPSSYHRLTALNQVPCRLRFISVEPLLESVQDIPLDGIGWVAVGGMSGPLHLAKRMQLSWAHEVYRRCRDAGIPFCSSRVPVYIPSAGSMALPATSRMWRVVLMMPSMA